MRGSSNNIDKSTDKLAPIIPYLSVNGKIVTASIKNLTKVIYATKFCFPTAKNSADETPDIALSIP